MTTINAKDFNSRKGLENYIRSEIGTDIEDNKNSDYVITGDREDLAKLNLSDTARVFGIDTKITDSPTKDNPGKKMSELRSKRK